MVSSIDVRNMLSRANKNVVPFNQMALRLQDGMVMAVKTLGSVLFFGGYSPSNESSSGRIRIGAGNWYH